MPFSVWLRQLLLLVAAANIGVHNVYWYWYTYCNKPHVVIMVPLGIIITYDTFRLRGRMLSPPTVEISWIFIFSWKFIFSSWLVRRVSKFLRPPQMVGRPIVGNSWKQNVSSLRLTGGLSVEISWKVIFGSSWLVVGGLRVPIYSKLILFSLQLIVVGWGSKFPGKIQETSILCSLQFFGGLSVEHYISYDVQPAVTTEISWKILLSEINVSSLSPPSSWLIGGLNCRNFLEISLPFSWLIVGVRVVGVRGLSCPLAGSVVASSSRGGWIFLDTISAGNNKTTAVCDTYYGWWS